jgi:DNA modification methylase
MRTINITDRTYVELEEILKIAQKKQMEMHGYIICVTPEDMIPWLIGYYRQMQKG